MYPTEGLGTPENTYYVRGDVKISFTQEKNSAIVKFVDFDGRTIGTPQTVSHGESVTAPADPIRAEDDYTYGFAGWNIPAGFGTLENIEILSDETDVITITATYTETYRANYLNFELLSDETYEVVGLKDGQNVENLYIPSTYNGRKVTSIRENSFSFMHCLNNVAIKTVEISDSVTNIGRMVFEMCINLESVKLPSGLTTISESLFMSCENLVNITIPNSVKTIENFAFDNCKKLKDIMIPSGVTIIDDHVFNDCLSLTSIIIPSSVKSIGVQTFRQCENLESVTLSDGLINIGTQAFQSCSLTSVTIPSSVENIEPYVFIGCVNLVSVEFKNQEGWNLTSSLDDTTGKAIDVSDASINATNYFNDSVLNGYYWKRN